LQADLAAVYSPFGGDASFSIAAVFYSPESMSRKYRRTMADTITPPEAEAVEVAVTEPAEVVATVTEVAPEAVEETTPTIINPAGLDEAGQPRRGWGYSYLIEPHGASSANLPTRVLTNCCDAGEAKRLYFATLGVSVAKHNVLITQVSDGG
jgi:hypothetical protein